MTPTLQNRLRNEVWSILPSYLETFVESIENAGKLSEFLDSRPRGMTNLHGQLGVINIRGALGKRLDRFEKLWLGMTDYDDIIEAIDEAEATASVQKIVLVFDSPGGSVMGLEEASDRIKAAKKPVVAYTDCLMASAAYRLGVHAESIYCSRSAIVGSIGARVLHVDQTGMLERWGIKVTMFGKGKHKNDFSPFKPLSDGEKKDLQALVDAAHSKFKKAVMSERKVDPIVFESKAYEGEEALELGLVDGHLDEVRQLLSFLG